MKCASLEDNKNFSYNNNKIKTIANEIVRLENNIKLNPELKNKYMELIEKITLNLTFQEMLLIDEYIQENKMLTK